MENETMMTLKAFLFCYGSLVILVVGLYVWTFAKLGELYKALNLHIQNTNIHVEATRAAEKSVCDERHKQIEIVFNEIKTELKEIKQHVINS